MKKIASLVRGAFGFSSVEPTANDIMKRLGRELSGQSALSVSDRARLARAVEVIQYSHEKLAQEHHIVRDLCARLRQLGFGDKRRVEALVHLINYGKDARQSPHLSAVRRILT